MFRYMSVILDKIYDDSDTGAPLFSARACSIDSLAADFAVGGSREPVKIYCHQRRVPSNLRPWVLCDALVRRALLAGLSGSVAADHFRLLGASGPDNPPVLAQHTVTSRRTTQSVLG